MIRLFEDAAEGITHKGRAPEFQALLRRGGEGGERRGGDKNRLFFPPLALSPFRPLTLMSHTIYGGHVDTVGQGMRALDQFPSFMLRLTELSFLAWMPADGGGIKENVRALESGEPGG